MKAVSDIYPAGPSNVPGDLTKPDSSYKKHAWLAVMGLMVFIALYIALATWFSWTAYRLIASGFEPGGHMFKALATGLPTAFLAIFMIKALFFLKRGQQSEDIELKAEQQPKLFEFLNQLADEAGAPRPHRVFVSPNVNACVFYDLTILNLIFPSKKNLEIGLGLVNVLNLGEIKAVLAHEFGHFAQKSMAVGNWVYIAHQVAAHIVHQRDILDRFIRGLSNFDIRIAWVGWLLGIIIWSIRSLLETAFGLVIISERALSREMEFQADLVSVSLTGSDALIHALHKLHAADEAWSRTLNFVSSEAREGRAVKDVFEIQSQIIKRLGAILDDPSYGQIPPLPSDNLESHRVFKEGMASVPKMWSTHPENFARENNAKKNYVWAECDTRPAWTIFDHVDHLRSQISLGLLDTSELEKADLKISIENLEKQYSKAYYFKNFRGAYLGRSITRYKDKASELYANYSNLQNIGDYLAKLYPPALSGHLEKTRQLYDEKYTLEGINAGTLNVSGGVIRFRGEQFKRNQLGKILRKVDDEIAKLEKSSQDHDIRCRTVHLAIAHKAGQAWENNLLGLLSLLHYADHTKANLHDIHGYMSHLVSVITADDRVTKKEQKKMLAAAKEAFSVLSGVYEAADQVELGSLLAKQLEVATWKEGLGKFELVEPDKDNIFEWMRVIDGWLSSTLNALSALETAALENLLKLEHHLAQNFLGKAELSSPPVAPKAPTDYTSFTEGSERKRDAKLSLWDRFYTANGLFAGAARFAVAASIVGGVVFAGYYTGGSTITIYNGLANLVIVEIDGERVAINAMQSKNLIVPPGASHAVSAWVSDKLVEKFTAKTPGGFGDYIYNIAQAAPMLEWTEVYGDAKGRPDRNLGAPRWFATEADFLFEGPPQSVNTKSKGATRDVLTAMTNMEPSSSLFYVSSGEEKSAMIRQHLLWDQASSPFMLHWVSQASDDKTIDLTALLYKRLENYENDVVALRSLQDYAIDDSTRDSVCQSHRSLAASHPGDGNLHYLATRCLNDETAKNNAYIDGAAKFQANSWLNSAAGYSLLEWGQWNKADELLGKALGYSGSHREFASVDLLRLKRMLGKNDRKVRAELARNSLSLTRILNYETGQGLDNSPYRFYSLLNKGDLKSATKAMREMENPHRALRLLAASDGASDRIINEAMKLPFNQGVDESTVLAAWSFAKRTRGNSLPYEKIAEKILRDSHIAMKALNNVRTKGAYAGFEKDLYGIQFVERGYAYAAACVLLGKNAPKEWKERANRILYATERPYFRT